jgi:hypothetical protein
MSYDSRTLEAKGQRRETHSIVERAWLSALLQSQNADGGWGFRKDALSRTEPTAWASLAAQKIDAPEPSEAANRGRDWLRRSQRGDGLWAQHSGMKGGSWVTAAACLALMNDSASEQALARGAVGLCKLQPREKGIGWKFRTFFQSQRHIQQDFSVVGWSWTQGTVSWVIPTSLALILLTKLPAALRPKGTAERIAMAEAMLLDRACPGGGWNCGNPMVYGVAGEALHEPTAWALLALRHLGMKPDIERGLEWIEKTREKTHGAASLALARLTLEAYGRSPELMDEFDIRLESSWEETRFLGNIASMALATIALTSGADVLRQAAPEVSR